MNHYTYLCEGGVFVFIYIFHFDRFDYKQTQWGSCARRSPADAVESGHEAERDVGGDEFRRQAVGVVKGLSGSERQREEKESTKRRKNPSTERDKA